MESLCQRRKKFMRCMCCAEMPAGLWPAPIRKLCRISCVSCLTRCCWPCQDLSAAGSTRKLQDAAGQTSRNQLLVLLDAPLVQRMPICGNQVCEPGERTIAGPNNLGAPAYCPMLACMRALPSSHHEGSLMQDANQTIVLASLYLTLYYG